MSRRTEYKPIVIEGWRDIRTSIGGGSAILSNGGGSANIGGGPSGCIDGNPGFWPVGWIDGWRG